MPPAFRILGPLEVEFADRVVVLGRRERALLGVLLLNAREVVSVDRLIDGVWGEAPPASAKHMVHEYVRRLRVALRDGSTIQTRVPGYVATCSDEDLDARLFDRLAMGARAAASAGDHAHALHVYEQALALWRGDALAGVDLEGDARIEVARLDEERLVVAEERVESALALGADRELIPELEQRVRDEPLRERSRAQLMIALYRAGRQVESLQRFREGRTLLVEHAGVEPGRQLRELERAILTQDPALDAAPAPRARDGPAPSVPMHPGWRRFAVAAGILLAVIAAGAFWFGRSGSADALARIDANSAGAVDPAGNRLVKQVSVGSGPGRMSAGFGSLWVVNDFDSTVSRIDPATGTVEQTIAVDSDPTAIAAGSGFVWVACTGTRSVNRIDPQLNRRVQRVPVGNGPSGIAVSPETLWVTNRLDDTVTEIDSHTGHVRRTFDAGPSPSDVTYGFGALWIANQSSASLTRLDPRTGGLQEVAVGNGPEGVAVGSGSIWAANSLDGTVSRVDPDSHVVTTFPVGIGRTSVLVSGGSIWVADSYGSRIVRIDPATTRVLSIIRIGSGPQDLASVGGRIWISTRETTPVHRGGTLRLFDLSTYETLDPAGGYVDVSMLSTVGDGLVSYKRVTGLDGGTPVPDLAAGLPRPTDQGRTYTFQLRRGIRYSNGEPVRASDFRRALERSLRIVSAVPRSELIGSELVGGAACSKTRCDLSRGIVVDDREGMVTLHLQRPDPEVFEKLALPGAYAVPRGASMTRPARLGIPGTGPYKIQSYARSRLVLVRNPFFREWSAAAQPSGYPDKIVKTYDDATGKQLTAVEHGKADLMTSPLPLSRLHELATRYAAQVHIFPSATTFAIFLNTRVPPFDNLAARRALSFAIDRRKAVAGFGGADAAAVTCQILPLGTPGYRPYCPYTRNPTAGGIWTGPDLARARKLVAASGTRGQRVTFWTGYKPLQLVVGHLAVTTLDRLGYRASLKVLGSEKAGGDTYFATINDSRTRAQAGFAAWYPDYPGASNFFSPLFTCRSFLPASENNQNFAEICNRRIDRAVDHALIQQAKSAPATATWSTVDRVVTDLAPWVPLMNTRTVVVVSRRVRNLQANTASGLLLDQIWIR